ncbi:MAG: aspartate-semialdehyde dehydrogenase [Myxococcales bacterium]|nr:aspartate-semialdehyde dehydrogenase [Myxococcales bacterium]
MTIRCAVVGATGIAGQQFLSALQGHPFFEVVRLAASARSAGKSYRQALTQPSGQVAWWDTPDALDRFGDMEVVEATQMSLEGVDLVFSAVESEPAWELESRFAERVPVISTASAFRYEPDVPIIIPAVNGEHARLIQVQRERRGWSGFVVPIPNCTTTGLAVALAPLHTHFGVKKVILTSMQATSGAGRSPGVIAQDIVDNVVPFIRNEEQKVEKETKKILGVVGDDSIVPADILVSATCTRVAVLDGHTEAVTVALDKPASLDEVKASLRSFGKDMNPRTHPSAPKDWIWVHEDPFRPQPRLDRDTQGGMTTSVGRLREDDVLGENGIKFVLVSHNTKAGAAKGAILVAEDLKSRGVIS